MSIASASLKLLKAAVRSPFGASCAYSVLRGLSALIPVRRGEAKQAIALSFPHLSSKEQNKLLRGVYRHFCTMLVEWARCVENPTLIDSLVSFEGPGLNELVNAKGAIILTAHLGNWEILCGAIARRGVPLVAVARDSKDVELSKEINSWRQRLGATVAVKNSERLFVKNLLGYLKEGKTVGLLSDQDGGWRGQSVQFLGRSCSMVTGPATLSYLSGAPIFPVFIHRAGEKHLATVGEPRYVNSALSKKEAIAELTNWCNEQIEEAVKKAPQEWFWFHRRWKNGGKG